MADLPQYQSQLTSSAPAAPVTGFQQASQSQSAIGLIADSVLDESSSQIARQAGIEAADRGQQPRFPGITRTDKEYVAAYEGQAYATAYAQGSKYLQQTAFELGKNPTPEALQLFAESAQEYAQGVSGTVSENVGRQLNKNLGSLFESYNAQLASAVEDRSQKILKENFTAGIKSNLEGIQQLELTGQHEAAAVQAAITNAIVDTSGDNIYLTPEQKAETKRAIATAVASARAIGDLYRLHQVHDDASAQDYLAKLAALPPNDKNDAVRAAAMNYQRNYESAKSGQEQVQFIQAEQLQLSGVSLGDILSAYPNLSAVDKERLKLANASIQSQAEQGAIQLDEANANARSPAYFANMSTKEKAGILGAKREQMFPGQDSLAHEAAAASTFQTTFTDLNNKAQDTITLGDAQQSIETMELVANVQQHHPQVFAGLDSKSQSMVQNYSALKRAGNDPLTAWQTASGLIKNVTPEMQAGRDKAFQEQTGASTAASYQLDTIAHAKKTVANAMGISQSYVDDGLIVTFREGLMTQNRIDGSMQMAAARVAASMKRVYGETTVNGETEYVYRPADKEVAGGADEVRNRLFKSVQPVLARINADYKDHDGDFYFEANSKPTADSYKGGRFGITEGGYIKLDKHYRDGSVQTVRLGIYADPLSSTDSTPEYFVAIRAGDSLLGLVDPATQSNMVFDLMGAE